MMSTAAIPVLLIMLVCARGESRLDLDQLVSAHTEAGFISRTGWIIRPLPQWVDVRSGEAIVALTDESYADSGRMRFSEAYQLILGQGVPSLSNVPKVARESWFSRIIFKRTSNSRRIPRPRLLEYWTNTSTWAAASDVVCGNPDGPVYDRLRALVRLENAKYYWKEAFGDRIALCLDMDTFVQERQSLGIWSDAQSRLTQTRGRSAIPIVQLRVADARWLPNPSARQRSAIVELERPWYNGELLSTVSWKWPSNFMYGTNFSIADGHGTGACPQYVERVILISDDSGTFVVGVMLRPFPPLPTHENEATIIPNITEPTANRVRERLRLRSF
jgi:hypothetical protein